MRERKSISARRPAAASGRKTSGRPKHDYSKELMELVVEAANSRVLPEFLRGFAMRTAEMLDAEWAGVGEIWGTVWRFTRGGPIFRQAKKNASGWPKACGGGGPGWKCFR